MTAPLRPFEESLPMALLRAREAAMRMFRPLLAAHDLTEQQWRVLRALASDGEPLEVGELVDRTFLLGPSVSRILRTLESRQLVSRQSVAHDQRRSRITLTGDGHRIVTEIAPRSEARYRMIEAQFGARRLGALLDELADLATLETPEAQEARAS